MINSHHIRFLGSLLGLVAIAGGILAASAPPAAPADQYLHPGQGCTVFYGADGDAVLAGNNEDFVNPLTYVWFVPAEQGRYGQVYFGFDDGVPQGAVNDQGLFYDGLALPYKAVQSAIKPIPLNRYPALLEEIFATASTVDQVEAIFARYNASGLEISQLLFGDRSGRSIIIDGDTTIRKEGKFQVATNFRLADYASAPPSVDRFDTATRMLSGADRFSVDLFRRVLDATHQEGPAPTQYSQVYDLKNNLIYLYHFHDFDRPVVLDIARELAKGPHSAQIASLFPSNPEWEDFARQPVQDHQAKNLDLAQVEAGADRLEDYLGEYRNSTNPADPATRIYLESGTLYAAKTGRPAAQLVPVGEDRFAHLFFYGGEELRIQFLRDGSGKVTGAEAAVTAEEFDFGLAYHLEKTSPRSALLPWILAAVLGGGLAAVAVWIRIRKPGRAPAGQDAASSTLGKHF